VRGADARPRGAAALTEVTTQLHLWRLRGAVRRARAARDTQQRRWLEAEREVARLERALQRVQSSLAGPLLRNWCCYADPPVLTALEHGDDPGEILTQGSRHSVRRPVRLDLIVFHTTGGMTNALDAVVADGHRDAISREALTGLSPYRTEHSNHFGDHILDLGQPPAPLPFALPARSQPAHQAAGFAEAVPV
jgi:hypothetical protein